MKYRVWIDWERKSLTRKVLTAKELDCLLEGLQYGFKNGVPKEVQVYVDIELV